jgi:hypothetical protein
MGRDESGEGVVVGDRGVVAARRMFAQRGGDRRGGVG